MLDIILLTSVYGIISLYISFPIICRIFPYLGHSLIFNHWLRMCCGKKILSDLGSAGVKNRGRNFYLESEPGIRIGVCPSSIPVDNRQGYTGNGRPVIVYAHGTGGSRAVPHRVDLYNRLCGPQMDAHVLALDYRGFAVFCLTSWTIGKLETINKLSFLSVCGCLFSGEAFGNLSVCSVRRSNECREWLWYIRHDVHPSHEEYDRFIQMQTECKTHCGDACDEVIILPAVDSSDLWEPHLIQLPEIGALHENRDRCECEEDLERIGGNWSDSKLCFPSFKRLNGSRSLIYLSIAPQSMSERVVTMYQVTDLTGFLSQMGGIMGIWLGMSITTLIQVMVYCCGGIAECCWERRPKDILPTTNDTDQNALDPNSPPREELAKRRDTTWL